MTEKLTLSCGIYEGETLNGKPHGKGKLTWQGETDLDGVIRIYEGDFVDGKMQGKGKLTIDGRK